MNHNINIFGVIGVDTTAKAVVPLIQAAKADPEATALTVNAYDSPGGSIFQGVAIYDAINDFKRETGLPVSGFGSGFVGSITTLILSAADKDKVYLTELTDYYIHNPFVEEASGDASELRKTADFIERKQDEMNLVYQKMTGLSEEDISFMMNNPVILSAKDAVELGFVSDVLRFVEVVNKYSKNMKSNFLTEFKKKLGGNQGSPEALALNLVNGTTADVLAAGEEIAVGDAVTVEGKPLPDGSHETQSGLILQMKAGRIESLTPKETTQADQILALQKQQAVLMEGIGELQHSVLGMVDLLKVQSDATEREKVSGGFVPPKPNVQSKGGQLPTVATAPKPEYKNMIQEMARIRAAAKKRRQGLR